MMKAIHADNIPRVSINCGMVFVLTFPSGKSISLTWEEWLGLRLAQNGLIRTEPIFAKENL